MCFVCDRFIISINSFELQLTSTHKVCVQSASTNSSDFHMECSLLSSFLRNHLQLIHLDLCMADHIRVNLMQMLIWCSHFFFLDVLKFVELNGNWDEKWKPVWDDLLSPNDIILEMTNSHHDFLDCQRETDKKQKNDANNLQTPMAGPFDLFIVCFCNQRSISAISVFFFFVVVPKSLINIRVVFVHILCGRSDFTTICNLRNGWMPEKCA